MIKRRQMMKWYRTKDQSMITEYFHPQQDSGLVNSSLAMAAVAAGQSTKPHRHIQAQEIYFCIQGQGNITIDGETELLQPMDAVLIPNGKLHWIVNTGDEELRFLCICSPAYQHEDTQVE